MSQSEEGAAEQVNETTSAAGQPEETPSAAGQTQGPAVGGDDQPVATQEPDGGEGGKGKVAAVAAGTGAA
ncbi:MAG: hypothetical protein ACRDLY_03855, partial [Thermoleophilaceae bacterium]